MGMDIHSTLAELDSLSARLNPPNGWGRYETAVEFVTGFRDGCAKWPAAFAERVG